jgi:GTP-binding protein
MSIKPIIAIVGRANVGKSTLFNRLAGKQVAIVEDLPGTTRDRVFADASLDDYKVTLIDTGGLDLPSDSGLSDKVRSQVQAAIDECDLILFMVDARSGIIATDIDLADVLRKTGKPVILLANKADNMKVENELGDFYALGFDAPLPVSAHHNRGISRIIERIAEFLPAQTEEEPVTGAVRLAIVGHPNVGKSMLLNAITGQERAIVDNTPGTTRDAVDTTIDYKGQKIVLVDTAGIRKRGKTGTGIDFYSLVRSLRALNRCDVAILVIDSYESITAQDAHIAGYIKDAYKGMVIIANKCDLISDMMQAEFEKYIVRRLKFMAYAPLIFTSAKTGKNVGKIIPAALEVWQQRQQQLANSVVDKFIKNAVDEHAPPSKGLRQLEVIRSYQDGINPPSFVFLVNDPELVHFSYQRYLENRLRETFGFQGTSIRFSFRKAPRRHRESTRGGDN